MFRFLSTLLTRKWHASQTTCNTVKGNVGAWLIGVFGFLVLSSVCGLVALPTTTLAKGKPGGGETAKFSVLPQPDIDNDLLVDGWENGLLIRGAWLRNEQDDWEVAGIFNLCGRASSSNVVINDPSPAIQLPMLLGFVDEDGDAWEDQNDPFRISGGTLVINAGNKQTGPTATYFFGARNKNGDNQMHRLDAAALIIGPENSDPLGENFPLGGETYTIFLTNWFLSHDTGSGKLAYEGPVSDGDTIIEVTRKP